MKQHIVLWLQGEIEKWFNSRLFPPLDDLDNHLCLSVVIAKAPDLGEKYQCRITDVTSEEMRLIIKECPILLDSIDRLDFSVRVRNRLRRAGIRTIGQLAQCNVQDLLEIVNFGDACLKEVRQKLDEIGLSLAGEG